MPGLLDPLCLPSNGRRMVARLQTANASGNPAIARFYDRSGHDFSDDESLAKEQIAEYLAFVMKYTGLRVCSRETANLHPLELDFDAGLAVRREP